MRKFFSVIIISMLSALCTQAQESQKVMSFLTIPTSSHAAALGGDNISIIEDDATLAMSNPSLLASVSDKSINLGYMNYMSGVNMFTAGFTKILSDKATIGGSAEYINYGNIQQRDANNNVVGSGTFTPSDLVLEPIFSYSLSKKLVGGIGAKFIYSKIGDYSSTAAAVDLGLNYYDPDLDLSVSATVKNLGGQLSAYNDVYENLPTDVLLGGSVGLGANLPIRVSLTMCDLGHWDYAFLQHACIGVDLKLIEQFYVAVGYNLRRAHDMTVTSSDGTESSHGAGLTVGAGLQLDRFSVQVSYGKYHLVSSSIMANFSFRL